MQRNRKNILEPKLVGVNRIADPSKLRLGTFQSLQNWIPAKRYKIKKKRGVELLINEAELLVPALCTGCPEGVLPEAQDLAGICCYDNTTGIWSPGSEIAGSISYVNPADENFWAISSQGSGFGTIYDPDNVASMIWKLWEPAVPGDAGCELVDVTTNIVPITGHMPAGIQNTLGANSRSGHSDERSYLLQMSDISPTFFNGDDRGAVYFGEITGSVPLLLSFPCGVWGPWTKFDDKVFGVIRCIDSDNYFLVRWPIPFADNYYEIQDPIISGGAAVPGCSMPDLENGTSLQSLHANETYLYALLSGPEFANPKIVAIDKSDLTFVDSWDIISADFTTVYGFHVFNDDIVFILNVANAGDATFTIGVIQLSTSTVNTIGSVTSHCTLPDGSSPSDTIGFHYANNYFYIGQDSGNVIKIGPLVCPGSVGILWEHAGE